MLQRSREPASDDPRPKARCVLGAVGIARASAGKDRRTVADYGGNWRRLAVDNRWPSSAQILSHCCLCITPAGVVAARCHFCSGRAAHANRYL